MDLEAEILREHSKRQTTKIARWVGSDKRRFRQLMGLFLHGEYRVTQRSAWIVGLCAEHHPELVGPWLRPMLAKMEEPGVHGAVRRNVVRILANIEVPRAILGTVVTRCFNCLSSETEEIAVKVHAMMAILRATRTEPGLKNELKEAIEQLLPTAGPAIRARARMVLSRLQK
jgi:hypothetical protein